MWRVWDPCSRHRTCTRRDWGTTLQDGREMFRCDDAVLWLCTCRASCQWCRIHFCGAGWSQKCRKRSWYTEQGQQEQTVNNVVCCIQEGRWHSIWYGIVWLTSRSEDELQQRWAMDLYLSFFSADTEKWEWGTAKIPDKNNCRYFVCETIPVIIVCRTLRIIGPICRDNKAICYRVKRWRQVCCSECCKCS